jgi:hypothetical protein
VVKINRDYLVTYLRKSYVVLGFLSGLMGLLFTFYLPAIELGIEIEYGITVYITEQFHIYELRNAIAERGGSTIYIDTSIFLLVLGSAMKFFGIFRKRSIIFGCVSYILSFTILAYKYGYKESSDSGELDFIYADPTVWFYLLLLFMILIIILSIIFKIDKLRPLNSNS